MAVSLLIFSSGLTDLFLFLSGDLLGEEVILGNLMLLFEFLLLYINQ